jgi:hypothetical protein
VLVPVLVPRPAKMRMARALLWPACVLVGCWLDFADGIKCWGGNAIALQREYGEAKACTHGADRFDLFRYSRDDVCFEKCAGVTWFEGFSTGGAPFANPDGKHLCPSIVDKGKYVGRPPFLSTPVHFSCIGDWRWC